MFDIEYRALITLQFITIKLSYIKFSSSLQKAKQVYHLNTVLTKKQAKIKLN